MANFNLQDNHGFLYPNKYQKHDKQPSHSGKAKINGKLYKVIGWEKIGKHEKPYLSFCLEDYKEWVDNKEPFVPTNHENDLDESIHHEQEF